MTERKRRASDPRVDQLVADVVALKQGQVEMKKALADNTEITVQVHDLLASFRIMAKVAKWVTTIAACAAALIAAAKGVITFNDVRDISAK